MEQELNDRADEATSDVTIEATDDARTEVVDEQLIEEISIDGMCGVY